MNLLNLNTSNLNSRSFIVEHDFNIFIANNFIRLMRLNVSPGSRVKLKKKKFYQKVGLRTFLQELPCKKGVKVTFLNVAILLHSMFACHS